MNLLVGFLFVIAAIISFYFSDNKMVNRKEIPLRLATMSFGIMGFRRLIATAGMDAMPETIPPNVMYALIIMMFGIGPEIFGIMGKGLAWFMWHTFWKNTEAKENETTVLSAH